MEVIRPNFEKRDGLVVVVAQDARSLEVLMVAYTDEAGWRKTLETGLGTYYSMSRKESWVKGQTSDNLQYVVDMLIDCGGDALIYLVVPQGHKVACHLNSRSCFAHHINSRRLMEVPDLPKELQQLPMVEVNVHKRFASMRVGSSAARIM